MASSDTSLTIPRQGQGGTRRFKMPVHVLIVRWSQELYHRRDSRFPGLLILSFQKIPFKLSASGAKVCLTAWHLLL